jgi:hypothetical protein
MIRNLSFTSYRRCSSSQRVALRIDRTFIVRYNNLQAVPA